MAFEISKTTHKILKNFAGMSNSLLLVPGEKQSTVAGKSVLAIADLKEGWPKETGIYDLSTFLSTLSLFENPTLEFGDEAFTLSKDKSRIKYRYSDPSTIPASPNKTLKTDNPDVTFELADSALQQLLKTIRVLQLPAVSISLEAGDVVVRALDPKNSTSHAFEYTVPSDMVTLTNKKAKVSLVFDQQHIGYLLDGTYQVTLSSSWNYGYFQHKTEPVSYFVVQKA